MSRTRIPIFAATLAIGFGLCGAALAAGAAPAAPQAATVTDMAGQLAVGQIAGGIADPVPIVATPTGLMLFTIGLPEETAPRNRPHALPKARTLQTHRIGQR